MNNNSTNTEKFVSFKPFDLREWGSNLVSQLLFGGGFSLYSTNKVIQSFLLNFQRKNNLYEYFLIMEKRLFLEGRVVHTLNRTFSGEIYLVQVESNFYNPVTRLYGKEVAAVLWSRKSYSQGQVYCEEHWDEEKVTRNFYSNQMVLLNLDEYVEIAKGDALPLVEYHNLGICPVNDMMNRPFWSSSQSITRSYPTDAAVINLQKTIDLAYSNLNQEIKANRTRIFLPNLTTKELLKMKQQHMETGNIGLIDSDFVFGVTTGAMQNPALAQNSNNKSMEILQGDPKFSQYMELVNQVQNQYLKGILMNDANNNLDVQKTDDEINYQKSRDTETFKALRVLRVNQINRLISDVLIMAGHWDGIGEQPFTFTIVGNDTPISQNIDDLIQLKQNNLISDSDMIQKIHSKTPVEADKYIKEDLVEEVEEEETQEKEEEDEEK